MVPEIALTPSVAGALPRARSATASPSSTAALSDGERHDQWHRIRRGDVDVVVGTRSAVFAPLDATRPRSSWTRSTTARTSRRRRRAITAATWRSCARAASGRSSCSARRRRRWRRYQNARDRQATTLVDARAARARSAAGRRARRQHARRVCATQGPDVVISRDAASRRSASGSQRGEQVARAAEPPRLSRRRSSAGSAATRSSARTAACRSPCITARQRLARALPLLQLLGDGAEDVPQVRGAVSRARRLRHRAGRGSSCASAFPDARIGARRSRLGPPQGRADASLLDGSRAASSTSSSARR